MGMGEPLLNLRAVVAAVRFLNAAVGIGARHITISTVGVPQAIARLAAQRMQATLAVSVHAPSQALRQQLIPRRARAPCTRPRPPRRREARLRGGRRARRSAKAYPLEALMADCRDFFAVTGRRVTFEYTLMAGVNDSPAQARRLPVAELACGGRARERRAPPAPPPRPPVYQAGWRGSGAAREGGAARRRASWPRCWSATTCAATST